MAARRRLFGPDYADPHALRSAADPAHRAGRRQGGDGVRRRRHSRSPISTPITSSCDASSFRSGFIMKPLMQARQGQPEARHLSPRARTSACCARRRPSSRRGSPRPILIGRPEVIEARLERFGLSIRPGARFRARQSAGRSALSRLCRDLSRGRRPARRHARRRAHAGAHQCHRDRRARGEARRCRRHALRRSTGASMRACATSATSSALRPGVERFRGDEPA